MLRIVIVIISLFMLIRPVIPVVDYMVNYDYIKNELCVNKEKPQLHCNGKCHLAKELAKASESSENNKDKKNIVTESIVVFFQEIDEIFTPRALFYNIQKIKIHSGYNLFYSYLNINSVFRPPIV